MFFICRCLWMRVYILISSFCHFFFASYIYLYKIVTIYVGIWWRINDRRNVLGEPYIFYALYVHCAFYVYFACCMCIFIFPILNTCFSLSLSQYILQWIDIGRWIYVYIFGFDCVLYPVEVCICYTIILYIVICVLYVASLVSTSTENFSKLKNWLYGGCINLHCEVQFASCLMQVR